MKRICLLFPVLLAAGSLACTAFAAEGAPAPAPTPTVAPPALQALEQKMAQISFNTARISVRSVLGKVNPVVDGELAADGTDSGRLITTTSTTLSYSPRAALATSTLDAAVGRRSLHRKLSERLIGRALYLYAPSLARSDGGRPWVRSEERIAAKPHGAGEGEPLAAVLAALNPAAATVPQPGERGTFVGLSEDLAAAASVREIASPTPLTVDGQSVTGFTATVPIASLLARHVSPKLLRRLLATAKPDVRTVTLEVFIASSGLPVRTTVEFAAGREGAAGEGVGVQEDVFALEVPVRVTPPPADRTIGEARLTALERRHRRAKRKPKPPAMPVAAGLIPATLATGASTAAESVSLGTPPAPEPAPTATIAPPALQALEQRMAQVSFNTARISDRQVIGEVGPPVGTAELGSGVDQCKSLVVTATGLIRGTPSAAVITSTLAGYRSRTIAVGDITYRYMRSVARYDGGRPWVRSRTVTSKSEQKPADSPPPSALTVLSASLGSTAPYRKHHGLARPFTGLVEDLNEALAIQEVGPATVDRQQTVEYTASLSVAKLLAGRLTREQHQLARKLEALPVTLDLFIAPNGMPVRTIVVVGTGKEGIGEEEDFLATGIPVLVHAPPARETIGQSRLDKLKRQRIKEGISETLTIGEPTSSMPQCPEEGTGPAGAKRAEPAGRLSLELRAGSPPAPPAEAGAPRRAH
jgi:hypothetical protein